MNIQKTLQDFGLSEREASVYLMLLRYVSTKPSLLARKLRVARPVVYDALEQLQKKGLVSSVVGKSTKMFSAKDPRALSVMIDRDVTEYVRTAQIKQEQLQMVMPDLLECAKEAVVVPTVRYFDGLKGIEEALYETLTTRDIIRAYADLDSITQTMGPAFDLYVKARIKKGIYARAIVPESAVWRERVKKSVVELRDVRFLSTDAFYSPEINIFDHTVLQISWKELCAVLITSKDFAQAQRVIFDELWSRLPRT